MGCLSICVTMYGLQTKETDRQMWEIRGFKSTFCETEIPHCFALELEPNNVGKSNVEDVRL